jgi:lysophospholipase
MEDAQLTHNQIRFDLGHQLYSEYPSIPIGGTTVSWVKTSLEWTMRIRKLVNVFQVPTVIYQAAEDTWVKPEGQNQICANSSKMCSIRIVAGAHHEILFENDGIRDQLMNYIRQVLGTL